MLTRYCSVFFHCFKEKTENVVKAKNCPNIGVNEMLLWFHLFGSYLHTSEKNILEKRSSNMYQG